VQAIRLIILSVSRETAGHQIGLVFRFKRGVKYSIAEGDQQLIIDVEVDTVGGESKTSKKSSVSTRILK
jgi:hypothetical protein